MSLLPMDAKMGETDLHEDGHMVLRTVFALRHHDGGVLLVIRLFTGGPLASPFANYASRCDQ